MWPSLGLKLAALVVWESPSSGGGGVRVRDAGRSQRMCKGEFHYEEYIQF